MDETYVMNQVKEDACFVSQDFMKDIEIAKKKGKANTIVREYVLPDFTSIRRGYLRAAGEKEDEMVRIFLHKKINNNKNKGNIT